MATFDFKCPKCDAKQEVRIESGSIHAVYCLQCNTKMVRQWSPPGIKFKGKGFYSTDNKKRR
jgi:putative FmdB family regulatory protein